MCVRCKVAAIPTLSILHCCIAADHSVNWGIITLRCARCYQASLTKRNAQLLCSLHMLVYVCTSHVMIVLRNALQG